MDPNNDTDHQGISLTMRVARGAGWVFVGKIIGQVLNLIKLVVLARLLSKTDFGLFGIVMLAIATLQTFSGTGFTQALIQRKDNAQAYLNTAWTVELIRGLVLACLLFMVAPAVGWFFDEPRVVVLLRVMCISVILGGCVNIGVIYFQKELIFHKQVIYTVGNEFVSLVVGLLLAYHLRSVWALIWAGMAGASTRVILSYILHEYRPTICLDKTQAAELFKFGRWVFGSSIIIFLATSGDDVFLGKVLGASALGLYQVAYRLSNVVATEITHITSAVMFPAYAKVQDQQAKLGRAFLSVLELVSALALPLTVFMVTAAPEIVVGLLGAKWEPAIIPLQILAVAGFLRSLAATGGPVFAGTGNPHMDFWMNLGRVSVIAITIYPLTKLFGVAGTSFSVVLGLAATLPVWTKSLSLTGVNWRQVLEKCWPAAILAMLVLLGVYFAKHFPSIDIQITLFWEVSVVSFLYGLGALVIWRVFDSGPFGPATRILSTFKKS